MTKEEAIWILENRTVTGELKPRVGGYTDLYDFCLEALKQISAQPKKVKWIKKMKVTKTDAYTSYDPEWYCPKCGTKYDPIFAQKVKFCCVCGVGIMGEQETPISRRFLQ